MNSVGFIKLQILILINFSFFFCCKDIGRCAQLILKFYAIELRGFARLCRFLDLMLMETFWINLGGGK